MGFTEAEKEARQRAIQQLLNAENLHALVFIGDANIGHSFFGDYRYFANNVIIFQRHVAVAFPDSEPVLFVYSQFSQGPARRRSFIGDVRTSSTYPAYHGIKQEDPMIMNVPPLLLERGISKGRVGVDFEMLPATWYEYLRNEMPQIEWVEAHEAIMSLRFERTKEEAEMYRKGAALGSAGFEAALQVIRPGVSEYEIVAEIEYAARKGGVEQHFTLIGSGKFAFGDSNTLPLPFIPSERRIEPGDSVVMEITPRYQGYWTQVVRMVDVGKSNEALRKMQTVARDAIKAGLEQFKPGKTVGQVTAAMASYVDSCGFVGKPPFGHICGIDLVEERVTLDNERVIQPGFVAILHPMVHTKDGKNVIFWGETYMATAEGYEKLHQVTDEVLTL